jgi:hypothetical protein
MTQEKAWRPADYWQHVNWAYETPAYCGSAESASALREPMIGRQDTARENVRALRRTRSAQQGSRQGSSSALPVTAWNLLAWGVVCGLVASVVVTLVAVFVLHLL